MVTQNSRTPEGTSVSRARFWLVGIVLSLAAAVAAPQSTYELVHAFRNSGGATMLIRAADGTLYGTTSWGGTYASGSIFRVDSSGAIVTLHSFGPYLVPTAGPGWDPDPNPTPVITIMQATDGKLYGTTNKGGDADQGTVFVLDPNGGFSVLHSFAPQGGPPDGARPYAPMIQGADGNLYGTTAFGGNGGVGTAFRVTPAGDFTLLHTFYTGIIDADGGRIYGGLVQATDGNFYGVAAFGAGGGSSELGTVFRMDPAGEVTVLHQFSGADGAGPRSSLIQASSGKLMGTTSGSRFYAPTVFEISTNGEFTLLHTFDPDSRPSGLVEAADGNFYGETAGGGNGGMGTIFRLTPSGTFTTVHDFGGNDGAAPIGGLAKSGDLFYGVTQAGGAGSTGTVFQIDANGTVVSLASFENEGEPVGLSTHLIQAADGMLYGVSNSGGRYGLGDVFRLNAYGELNEIHSFSEAEAGSPYSALIQAQNGQLYGTARNGGQMGYGTVYTITFSGHLDAIHNFNGTDGANPEAALVQGADSTFYGTTVGGGGPGLGTVFAMDASGNFLWLNAFDGSNGASPRAPLALDELGLFGTAEMGGNNWQGTVYSPGGSNDIAVLHSFEYGYEGYPADAVTPVPSPYGWMFGVDRGGSYGAGGIFRIDRFIDPEFNFAWVHGFGNLDDGAMPSGPLIQTSDGMLFGTTKWMGLEQDGENYLGQGTVYKLDIYGTNYGIVHAFNTGFGRYPIGGLIEATDGRLYGVTESGGPFGNGSVVFRLSDAEIAVNQVSPTSGNGQAGAVLTVLGGGFVPGATVTIGGVAGTNVTVVDSTFLHLLVPALPPGTYDVTVTTPGGASATHPAAYVVKVAGPTITGFTPAAGPINVKVTVNGTGFVGVTSVKFNGKAASFTVLSPTQLTANVSGGTTSGKITVTSAAGTATSATDFLVAYPPTVTGFTPGSGVVGTAVVITGTNFDTTTAVAFNGFAATFTINSSTQITATVPPLATTGKIKVTNVAGGAYTTAAFLVPPTITSFTPASGLAGISVIINGATFNNASSVNFNGVAATFTLNSSTKITAIAPPGVTTGKIAVTTPGGTTASAANFMVLPRITSFTPTAGPINVKVTINGTSFTGVTSVKFNGKAASFSVLSPTQLTANVSAGTTSGKITVTTAAGTATSTGDFTVVFPPTVTGFTPGSGVPGTPVVITGTNFDTATAVAFNTTSTTAFTIDSPTKITVNVPAGATTGKIKVTNVAGSAPSSATFLVPPTITSFSPTSGRAGASVTINGTTFKGASSVKFNGVAASFTVNSSTKITATVPTGATTGKISVTTTGGTANSATNFTVLP